MPPITQEFLEKELAGLKAAAAQKQREYNTLQGAMEAVKNLLVYLNEPPQESKEEKKADANLLEFLNTAKEVGELTASPAVCSCTVSGETAIVNRECPVHGFMAGHGTGTTWKHGDADAMEWSSRRASRNENPG